MPPYFYLPRALFSSLRSSPLPLSYLLPLRRRKFLQIPEEIQGGQSEFTAVVSTILHRRRLHRSHQASLTESFTGKFPCPSRSLPFPPPSPVLSSSPSHFPPTSLLFCDKVFSDPDGGERGDHLPDAEPHCPGAVLREPHRHGGHLLPLLRGFPDQPIGRREGAAGQGHPPPRAGQRRGRGAALQRAARGPTGDLNVYRDVNRRVQWHRDNRVRVSIARWLHTHFSSTWTAISFVAVLLLFFTAVQTVFTVTPWIETSLVESAK